MEDLRENFVLLSKVAKEKKYAQEYLGLLARRGDIGSIRIGKRWYTTWKWFEEFLENSNKKKAENIVETLQVEKSKAEAVPIELQKKEIEEVGEKPAPEEIAELKVKINLPWPAAPKILRTTGDIIQREKMVRAPEVKIKSQAVSSQEHFSTPPVLPSPGGQRTQQVAYASQNVIREEIKLRKSAEILSPDFSEKEHMSLLSFGKVAFAAAFVITFLFLGTSAYLLSDQFKRRGIVAGASDERNADSSSIRSISGYYVESAGDKIKETISLSRLVIEAAREKTAAVDQH